MASKDVLPPFGATRARGLLFIGLLAAAGCSGKDELPPPPGTDDGAADDTQPDDTGPDTTDPADDTGAETGLDTAPDETGAPDTDAHAGARLEAGGVVTCADPSAREASPIESWNPGGDWESQDWMTPDTVVAGAGVTVADLTGDGLLDIVLPHWEQDQLFVARAGGGFDDKTATHWPSEVTSNSATATVADIDGDADLDLYLCNMEGDDHLLINDGSGHFSDGTAAAGLSGRDRRCMGSSFGDMDGDGDLDLFVADYLWCLGDPETGETVCDRDPDTLSPQSLWENQGDGSFVDVSERLSRDTLVHSLMHGSVWIDVDLDGDQDLYVLNDSREEIAWVEPNLLYLNDGAGGLTRVEEGSQAELAMASMGLAVGDLNGDEYPDLLISDNYGVVLLESLGLMDWFNGALARGLDVRPTETDRETGWGTLLEDFDNDRDLDTAVVFGVLFPDGESFGAMEQPDALFLQGDDGQFEEIADAWGFSDTHVGRSLGIIDIDGDGWMDFLRSPLNGPAMLHRGRCGAEGWLEVHLRDDATPNRFGVGARVRLTTGGERQLRWIFAGGTSIHTSLQPQAHFGLGDPETFDAVDTLEILWPDGATSTFTDVTPNQRVTITRESL